MKTHSNLIFAACLLTATTLNSQIATAAPSRELAKSSGGTNSALAVKYSEVLDSLKEDVTKSLPKISPATKDAFIKAHEAAIAAQAAEMEAMAAANGRGTKDKEAAKKAFADAQQAYTDAQANAEQAAKALLAELEPFLASDKLDSTLFKSTLLSQATARGLADFAKHGRKQQDLVSKLMGDDAMLKQMLIAGGARNGKYGEAMRIYSAIQKASPKSTEGLFQRLALATALELAVPIEENKPADQAGSPTIIDPVKRYLHYEKAWLDGELDPAFKNLSVWELRMVVNCDASDEILTWGREMLRNYRPDHRRTDNPGWRYSILVKTDVLYGSQNVKDDVPSLQQYQNIVRNGGVCGRRAFFGRFILRSHGIPVWGVTQKAHAAVGRWTPDGWVVNLGAAFKWSWWDKDEAPRSGSDFLLETQAREAAPEYLKVLRAQWISHILGETPYNDRKAIAGDFWSAVANYQARAIASAIDAKELATVGEDIAESNESTEDVAIEDTQVTEEDMKIVIGQDGSLTIPAVALTTSANPGVFISMVCASGGKQLHCNRDMKSEQQFEYTFDAPRAGKYELTANVVTVQADQKFLLTVNKASAPLEIPVPYTIGLWDKTPPVAITLEKGANTLQFTRPAPSRGVTIKDFTLKPVK